METFSAHPHQEFCPGTWIVVSPFLPDTDGGGEPFCLTKSRDIAGWPNPLLEAMRKDPNCPKRFVVTVDVVSNDPFPCMSRPDFYMIAFEVDGRTVGGALCGPVEDCIESNVDITRFNETTRKLPKKWVTIVILS